MSMLYRVDYIRYNMPYTVWVMSPDTNKTEENKKSVQEYVEWNFAITSSIREATSEEYRMVKTLNLPIYTA